ncbi:Choline/ethanolaminephosphotransferase [Eremomyces bilateralis CBS 781.70]|uniref:diacylglycerol cholinephosphotransferase n=1 Tax=Eremomyces bilateralis CBS 781.70 TaxID=1392243 RepID=A0A6G1FWA5_9PEZI|nr:Choline/ethanolaminephosphotransferase [Eremomyces bilateralis CBS 781.70]KAF1809960.1 Choline/ethanolaminephosphotransferase [Eremomyces bilateralis CBS 781.70]
MVYIRQDKLPRLKEYKYSGVDKSLTSRYILKPFYTHVVIKLFPMWMAPNLITLSGFSFVVINFLTLLWYTPGLDTDCPPWVYASWSIGLFLYQTFDAVDGTQARRTGQSGPLGELFDHGVDSLNTSLEVLIFSATMNLGEGWRTVAVLFASLGTFYVQTWEEYHTHTLTLGLISGPVEGILTLCVIYGLTAFLGGGSFWSNSLMATLGVSKAAWIPDFIYNSAFTDWYIFYGSIMLIVNTVQAAQNVIEVRRAEGKKGRVALLGLLPFAITWVLVPAYLALQPKILHHHLVPFIFFVGLTNAYSVGRMICAHLTKSAFPRSNILWLPLFLGIVDSMGPVLQREVSAKIGLDGWLGWPSALGEDVYQVAFMFLCLGMGIGVYGSFVVDVIVAICDYLDIWCLTIKHPNIPVPVKEHKKTK